MHVILLLIYYKLLVFNMFSYVITDGNYSNSKCFIHGHYTNINYFSNFKAGWGVWLVLKSVFLSRFYIIILHLKYQ
jgi:hypothetical protein